MITQYYTLIPLDIDNLNVDLYFKKTHFFSEKQDVTVSEVLKRLLREAIDYCILTHDKLLDLNTVSFDLIISSDGPIMIEANYNWSIELLYFVIDPMDNNPVHPAGQWLNRVGL